MRLHTVTRATWKEPEGRALDLKVAIARRCISRSCSRLVLSAAEGGGALRALMRQNDDQRRSGGVEAADACHCICDARTYPSTHRRDARDGCTRFNLGSISARSRFDLGGRDRRGPCGMRASAEAALPRAPRTATPSFGRSGTPSPSHIPGQRACQRQLRARGRGDRGAEEQRSYWRVLACGHEARTRV